MNEGTRVVLSAKPWYRGVTGKRRNAPRKYRGREGVVLAGGPDRDGDIPVKIDGIFYADQLAPECLTVVLAA